MPLTSAIGISIDSDPLQTLVSPDQEARFLLKVTNEDDTPHTFNFYCFEQDWDLEADSLYIEPRTTEEIEITLTPTESQEAKIHDIPIKVIAEDDDTIYVEHYTNLKVVSEAIPSSINFPSTVTGDFTVIVELTNRNNQEKNILVKLESELFSYEQEIYLEPLEEKNIEFEVTPELIGGTHEIFVEIYENNILVGDSYDTFTINLESDFLEDKTSEEQFLKTEYSYSITNTGNAKIEKTYQVEFSWFNSLFLNYNIEPDSIENKEYSWSISLEPEESFELNYSISYRLFLTILIILAILAVLTYFYINRDLIITKKLISINKKGEHNTIKVMLILKNKGVKSIKNIRLMDTVIKTKENPHNFGSLKPDKYIRKSNGISMIWNISKLAKKEERVISYSVDIKDVSSLPSAVIRYRQNYRNVIISSNKVELIKK